jgi:phage/plasmid-like protein (TIGR03299 family)
LLSSIKSLRRGYVAHARDQITELAESCTREIKTGVSNVFAHARRRAEGADNSYYFTRDCRVQKTILEIISNCYLTPVIICYTVFVPDNGPGQMKEGMMSKETMEWLNSMTLIGFSSKRGKAWHYRESMQQGEPNHYEGAVPVEDIKRRLFNFQLVESPLYVVVPCEINDATTVTGDGAPAKMVVVEDRKAIRASDSSDVLGIFKGGYQLSQYTQALLEDMEAIAGNGVEFASAGLLQNRSVAWVQLETSETLTVCGYDYRPFLMGVDSCNGSLARTYNKGNTAVVCDNTMAESLLSSLAIFKLKHTKFAKFDANTVRDALGILEEIGAEFADSIETLTNWAVTDEDWAKFLDEVCKFDANAKTTRSATIAQNKRDDLVKLWEADERVTPWKGTAFGVLQATNTWGQHVQTVRGASRADRNMLNAITGASSKADAETLKVLELVCA